MNELTIQEMLSHFKLIGSYMFHFGLVKSILLLRTCPKNVNPIGPITQVKKQLMPGGGKYLKVIK